MEFVYNRIFLEHDTGIHPESIRRFDYLKNVKESKITNGEKYLFLIHPKTYIDFVKKACSESRDLDSDTKTCPKTYQAACYAVGATIQAADKGDFALVRPPGHHATADRAMGFCVFNSTAIAVQKLVNEGKKVFILDFDCHYGNGTAEIFYRNPSVVYMSLHQYPYYPGNGFVNEIGAGDAKGHTINIPIVSKTGDDIYFETLNFFIPMIRDQFKPDIVCCGAGFDGHHSDPICDLGYSLHAYYETGRLLRENFKKSFATLEGGYDPVWLAKCAMSFKDGVNGAEPKFNDDPKTTTIAYNRKKFEDNFAQLKENLKPYWNLN
ncbi:histone deacetylase family protein [Candidatus Woesearchaeota archaeon]|nr:histone deacetylase family protein [Candidatus Woesearchaeota archaeon]